MPSILIITAVEKLQATIVKAVASFQEAPGIYVSLNKTQKSTELMLTQNNVKTEKLFFIDCMTNEKTRDDVLHISPGQLEMLTTAIEAFIIEIKGDKYLVIDAISTLLIYNDENKVAQFVKQMTELASRNQVNVIAFSPETKGEELLNKIYNFFDKVEKR
jgi:hypothetical protein